MSESGNGNGNGKGIPMSVSLFGTATIVVGLAVLSAFWMLSDPRNDIRTIKETYLSLREHEEFKARIDRAFASFIEQNRQQDDHFLSRAEFERWRIEHDKRLETTTQEIDRIKSTFATVEASRLHADKDKALLDAFEKRLDNIRNDVSLILRLHSTPVQPGPWPQPNGR